MTSSEKVAVSPDDAAAMPLRRTQFPRFFVARLLSLTGSVITSVALPLLVLGGSGSYLLTAAVTTTATAPYLLFGLLAGAIADRGHRRRLMISAQCVSLTALATIPAVTVWGDGPTPEHALAVSFITGTCFVFFDAACFGALPMLVDKRQLVRANSVLWTSASLIDAGFPAVAGLLVVALGAGGALSAEVVLLACSALCFASIRTPLDPPQAADATRPSLASGMGEGLRFLWNHRLIRTFTLIGAFSSLVNGMVVGLLAVITRSLLGFGEGDPRTGLAWTFLAVGSAIGALLLPHARRVLGVGRVTVVALACYPAILGALALSSWTGLGPVASPWLGLAALGVWGTAVSLVVLNGISLRQEVTPLDMQSRVNTTARMIAWGGVPLGALVGGMLAAQFGMRTTIVVGTVYACGLAVAGAASGLLRYGKGATPREG